MASFSRRPLQVKKVNMKAPKQDATYWQTQPHHLRLAALEEIRREFHQWKYNAEPRFQRVYTIAKR
ncbi:MAG: hypothetical protein KME43_20685 [Myxacorys chilensis ATA2-1-KO14]|nr:hypothetical protein [Myxacorys chilensis ATA2-1-KO14]